MDDDKTYLALKPLLNFGINNRDLDELNSLISAFNPFKILGITDFEIRHSNVLAWLLDPTGHHGLRDTLFKRLLLAILKDNSGDELPNIDEVMGMDFSDLKVLREWMNIDILAVSQVNHLLLVVENKINANEEIQQLTKYADIVDKRYPDYAKVFIFLSLDGTAPQWNHRYIVFTHRQVCEIVQPVVKIRRDYMNNEVYNFIQQYLNILGEKTMQNNEMLTLCAKLYKEHREAIKMIVEYGRPKLLPENIQAFHSQTDTKSFYMDKESVNVYYSFIPILWDNIVPETNRYTSDRYLAFFQLNFSAYENHKIILTLNIGNFPDPEERRKFIELVDEAVSANAKSKLTIRKSSKTNTVIFRKDILLEDSTSGKCDLEDYETVTAKLVEAYNSSEVQDALEIVDGVVKAVFKKV